MATATVKKATLYGPTGQKEVVDVGSKRASELQSYGWQLSEAGYKSAKKATLWNPGGTTAEVVYAGSKRASSLQSQGWQLTKELATSSKSIINSNQNADMETKADNPPSIYDTAIEKASQSFFEGIGNRPVAPSMVDTYKNLMGEKSDTNPSGLGITTLESQLSDLQNQEAAIRKTAKERAAFEEGKPVALGVIAGKQSEIDRQTQQQLSDIAIQKTAVTNTLNMKYNMVNTMMSLTKMDYENAVADYDSKFSKAIDAINLMRGLRTDAENAKDRIETDARANLQIIYNGIEKGSVDFSKLDPNIKASITKWETQAGLPAGFVQTIKSTNPLSEIVSTTSRTDASGKKYVDLVMRNKDGSISVKSAYLGQEKVSSGGGGDTAQEKQDKIIDSFNRDLLNPSNVGIKKEIASKGEEKTKPNDYVNRETLIAKLISQWGRKIEPNDIRKAVYEAYP